MIITAGNGNRTPAAPLPELRKNRLIIIEYSDIGKILIHGVEPKEN